jgi:ABC-type antimicrobial peptide transport system ATPase subunit
LKHTYQDLEVIKFALQVKIADASHNLSKAHLIQETELQDKLRTKYIKVLNELGMIGSAMERPLVYENGQWIEVA